MQTPYGELESFKYYDGFFFKLVNIAYPILYHLHNEYGLSINELLVELLANLYDKNHVNYRQVKPYMNNPQLSDPECGFDYRYIGVAIELYLSPELALLSKFTLAAEHNKADQILRKRNAIRKTIHLVYSGHKQFLKDEKGLSIDGVYEHLCKCAKEGKTLQDQDIYVCRKKYYLKLFANENTLVKFQNIESTNKDIYRDGLWSATQGQDRSHAMKYLKNIEGDLLPKDLMTKLIIESTLTEYYEKYCEGQRRSTRWFGKLFRF